MAIVVAVSVVGACGDAAPKDRPDPEAPSDATAARTVCEALRAWENRLIDAANDAAATATSADEPDERAAALVNGFDRLTLETAALTDIVEAITFPDDPRWQALRADLIAGPPAAAVELADERQEMESLGPIQPADERGRVGQFFNSLEKVFSLVEPRLGAEADESMRSAFTNDRACTHVVES